MKKSIGDPHISTSALKVTIFGNCQGEGIASLMQAMTGDVNATAIKVTGPAVADLHSGKLEIASLIAGRDLIFVQGVGEIFTLIKQQFPAELHKVRRIPVLNFPAYQPDAIYILSRMQGKGISGPLGQYQSAIAFAGWLNGLSVKETISLFRDEVFDALGYYSYWDTSKKSLIDNSDRAGFAISDLLEKWHRQGCWLHQTNHPKLFALADVARRLLKTEGIETLPGVESYLEDARATGPVWPVYPEIGKHLGVAGNYYFKRPKGGCPPEKPVLMLGLEDFVLESYAVFEQYGRDDLSNERMLTPRYQNLRRFVRSSIKSVVSSDVQTSGATPTRVFGNALPSGRGHSPYQGLPDHQFWRRAMERLPMQDVDPVVCSSFTLSRDDKVATAGSCFAQHISRTLQKNGFNYYIAERGEDLPPGEAQQRNYGVFSARFGNLYTTRQLLQLFDRAYGNFTPAESYWVREDGRLVDAFRPQVEPEGFATLEELESSRAAHFAAVREMFETLDVFVFTLGLTESWRSRIDGAVYPLAPGVVAGKMDPASHEFVNFGVSEVVADMQLFVEKLLGVNPRAKMILTVSPVPLIATYEDRHVLVSNTYSKSVLRVAAEEISQRNPLCDYFPSFEIITGNHAKGDYFESDLRSVKTEGVEHVMRLFLAHYAAVEKQVSSLEEKQGNSLEQELMRENAQVAAVVCDEEAIDAGD